MEGRFVILEALALVCAILGLLFCVIRGLNWFIGVIAGHSKRKHFRIVRDKIHEQRHVEKLGGPQM